MCIAPAALIRKSRTEPSWPAATSAGIPLVDPPSMTLEPPPDSPTVSSEERPSPFCQSTRATPSASEAIATAVHVAEASEYGVAVQWFDPSTV